MAAHAEPLYFCGKAREGFRISVVHNGRRETPCSFGQATFRKVRQLAFHSSRLPGHFVVTVAGHRLKCHNATPTRTERVISCHDATRFVMLVHREGQSQRQRRSGTLLTG
jgi:hypothetical protein